MWAGREVAVAVAGALELRVDGEVVPTTALRGSVARRALTILAVERRPLGRDQLAESIWGDALPRTWETALRGAIHKVRRALGPASGAIRTAFGSYELDPNAYVDVIAALDDLAAAESAIRTGSLDEALSRARSAAIVLGRPLLPGEDGPWFNDRRNWLLGHARRALITASTASTALGDHVQAIAAAEEAIRHDPYQEEAHRRLMAAHAAAGHRAEALIAYRACRALLADELGVDPSDETEAAYVALLGAEPGSAMSPLPPVVVPRDLPSSLRPSMPCVGRATTLQALRRLWLDIRAGGSAVCVLAGPAGVGKSRLAAEVAALAHADGAVAVHGRFDPDEFGAFGAFTAVLGQIGVVWPPPLSDPGTDRSMLFADVVEALNRVAEDRPLVLVLDDLHWADRASVALLQHLLVEQRPRRTLIVGTARDDIVNAPLTSMLRAGDDGVQRVDVTPLDRAATAELVEAWSGHRGRDALIDWLHERCAGNPYFVLAVLASLVEGTPSGLSSGLASIEVSPESVRMSLHDVLLDACQSVEGEPEVLTVAAIIGMEFRADVLSAVAHIDSADILVTLDDAARRGLVGQCAGDPGRFRFVHALIREALLVAVDDAEACRMHTVVADVFERDTAPDTDVVHHLLAAGDEPSVRRAAQRAASAAQELQSLGAPDVARDMLLDVVAAVDASSLDATEERTTLAASLAAVSFTLGDVVAGREHMRSAVQSAVTEQRPDNLWPLAYGTRNPDAGEVDHELIRLVRTLLAIESGRTELRASLLCMLNAELAWSDSKGATEAAAEAMEIASELRDPRLFGVAVAAWHRNGFNHVDPSVRRGSLEKAVRDASSRRPSVGLAKALHCLTETLVELGDRNAAVEALERASEVAQLQRDSLAAYACARTNLLVATLDGRWNDAEELAATSRELGRRVRSRDVSLVDGAQLIWRRYHQGRLAELWETVELTADKAPSMPTIQSIAALVAAELGMEGAWVRVDTAIGALRHPSPDRLWQTNVAVACEAAAAMGHPGVLELAAMLQPFSGRHVIMANMAYLGAVDRLLGLAAAAEGRLDDAVRLLDLALTQHRAVPSPPYIARTAGELAEVLEIRGAPGDAERATALAHEAAALRADHAPQGVFRSHGFRAVGTTEN